MQVINLCKIDLRCEKKFRVGVKIRVGRVSGNTQFCRIQPIHPYTHQRNELIIFIENEA